MPTTAQPAAGTALHADWTTSMVARNEAETTSTTLAAGTATRTAISSDVLFSTDADGRYLIGNSGGVGSREEWSSLSIGAERTLMVIVKRVASGATQTLIDSDTGASPNRVWQFNMQAAGTVQWIGWNTLNALDANFTTSAAVSTTAPIPVIVRVRNDAGTYRAKIWVGTTATAEVAYTGTPLGLSLPMALGDRRGGSQRLDSKIYFWAIWNAALSDTDCTALAANGWAVFDAKAGGGGGGSSIKRLPAQLAGGMRELSGGMQ